MGLKSQRPVEASALPIAGAAPHPPLTADLRFRIVAKLITAPHGSKAAVAAQLAAETGKGVRTLHRWRKRFQQGGYPALSRQTRSEKGCHRIYSTEEWPALIEAAWRVRRGKMRSEFRALRLPGSFETFRSSVWQVRRHETPAREGDKIA